MGSSRKHLIAPWKRSSSITCVDLITAGSLNNRRKKEKQTTTCRAGCVDRAWRFTVGRRVLADGERPTEPGREWLHSRWEEKKIKRDRRRGEKGRRWRVDSVSRCIIECNDQSTNRIFILPVRRHAGNNDVVCSLLTRFRIYDYISAWYTPNYNNTTDKREERRCEGDKNALL